jgi:hypothetical protein
MIQYVFELRIIKMEESFDEKEEERKESGISRPEILPKIQLRT